VPSTATRPSAEDHPAPPAPPLPQRSAPFAAFRHRNFTLLWCGLIASNAGTQMQNIGQGWLVYEQTHSPFWLGMVSLAFALPMVLLPLVGGAIADRVDRLRLLKITQTGQMVTAGVLTLLTVAGLTNVWWVMLASFVGACFLAADNPARQSLYPDLVPRQELLGAAALTSATYTGAALIGPALGGALLPLLHPAGLFLLNTVSFLAVLGALFAIHGIPPRPAQTPTPVGRSLQQAVRYIRGQRLVLGLLLLSGVIGVFGRSYLPLTPAFATDILHTDELGYGLLFAAPGLGALLAAGALAGGRSGVRWRVLVGAGLGFAALLIAYSASATYLLSQALLVGAGVTSQVSATVINTALQLLAPRSLRGRVLSFYTITIIGLASLGALGTGVLAVRTGPALAVALAADVMALGTVILAPFLRDLDTAAAQAHAADAAET
jgi:MFS family permease